MPPNGARSTDEFWAEFSCRFHPPIIEEVVLASRGGQAEQIVKHLIGKSGSLVFIADGPDEVSAVAVAAIRKTSTETREFLEARTLVVDSDEAGRGLAVADRYGYVISPTANKVSGWLSGFGPAVSGLGISSSGQKYPRLNRPSTRDMAEALQSMALREEEASVLALKSGRSLTILERQIAAASFVPPDWVAKGRLLLPALFAGGWDFAPRGRPGDTRGAWRGFRLFVTRVGAA